MTFLFVALLGITVSVSFSLSPTSKVKVVLSKDTPVTLTVTLIGFTVTSQVFVLPPSTVVTVIVVFPSAFAVTVPSSLTSATVGLLLVQVTFLFVASLGSIASMSFSL